MPLWGMAVEGSTFELPPQVVARIHDQAVFAVNDGASIPMVEIRISKEAAGRAKSPIRSQVRTTFLTVLDSYSTGSKMARWLRRLFLGMLQINSPMTSPRRSARLYGAKKWRWLIDHTKRCLRTAPKANSFSGKTETPAASC